MSSFSLFSFYLVKNNFLFRISIKIMGKKRRIVQVKHIVQGKLKRKAAGRAGITCNWKLQTAHSKNLSSPTILYIFIAICSNKTKKQLWPYKFTVHRQSCMKYQNMMEEEWGRKEEGIIGYHQPVAASQMNTLEHNSWKGPSLVPSYSGIFHKHTHNNW